MAQVIECLREYCEIDFMLELIEAGLNSGNLDTRDVEEIRRDTSLDNDDYLKAGARYDNCIQDLGNRLDRL